MIKAKKILFFSITLTGLLILFNEAHCQNLQAEDSNDLIMRFFESNGYEFTAKVKFSEYFDFVAVHKTDPLEMVQIIHGSGLSTSVQRVSSEMIIQKLLVLL